MSANWTKRIIGVVVLGLIVVGVAWFAWPRPLPVDLATIAKGPIEVTADDDGKTHVRHIYTVSAPVAGKVLRISHPLGEQGPSVHVGDQVTANETVVALMQPTPPSFIDVRSRDQLQAEVISADAAIQQQEAEVRRLEAAVDFSRTEFQRAQTLSRSQTISAQAFDKAKFDVASNEAALASAKAQVDVRRSLRASLAARLIDPTHIAPSADSACCVRVIVPARGRGLKIIQDSEQCLWGRSSARQGLPANYAGRRPEPWHSPAPLHCSRRQTSPCQKLERRSFDCARAFVPSGTRSVRNRPLLPTAALPLPVVGWPRQPISPRLAIGRASARR